MTNKGQILPLFVLLIPVLLIFVGYIVDIGLMYTEKRKMTNICKDAIVYYIDHESNDEVYNNTIIFINKNIKNVNVDINDYGESITISIKKKHKSLYNIININTEINITYTGYKIDKRIVKG